MTTLHWISADAPPEAFPPASEALRDPDGLLAAGGDLSRKRLLAAYRRGIFPWYESGQPVLWWSPDPRAFLFSDGLRISRRFRRTLSRSDAVLTMDQDFEAVIRGCAAPRRDGPGTWITDAMIRAYCNLHESGFAHSAELWADGELAGGLYGVAIGRMFYAESMFSRRRDASKIILAALLWQLAKWGFPGIDCQVRSAHLESLGITMLQRQHFLEINTHHLQETGPDTWRFDPGIVASGLARPGPRDDA